MLNKFSIFGDYLRLARLDKPIGILLLLWPTLWALWLGARGIPDLFILFIFISGVILMRSSGCIINDCIDHKLDRKISRTQNRPLSLGRISLTGALVAFMLLLVLSFILVLFTNTGTILLSIAAIVLTLIYPWCKRFMPTPQIFLGITFAWSIPMAFMAQMQTIPLSGWYLYLTTLVWVITYDTIYAMADCLEDKKVGIKSTAVFFGVFDKVMIFALQLIFLLMWLVLLVYLDLITAYSVLALLIVIMLFAYQQYLIKDRNPVKCLTAFKNNNLVGVVLFVGLFLSM